MNATTWISERIGTSNPGRAAVRAGRPVGLGMRQMRENDTLRIRPGPGGLVIRGRSGTFMVTQAGDPEDHVVEARGAFRADGRGVVVVWAFSDGMVELEAA